MAETTHIEWTDATWNPVTGCTLASEGCRHCYAAALAAGRLRHHPSRAGLARMNAAGEARFTGEVRFNEGWLDQPLRWTRPRRVFVCAHGDLFHESVPDEWIDKVFAVMALAPQHTFQVLTKRPERARVYLERDPRDAINSEAGMIVDWSEMTVHPAWPLPNVWLGTSVEDRATADARIPHLLETPSAVRFVSAEPLLGPLDLTEWLHDSDCDSLSTRFGPDYLCTCQEPHEVRLDWVIVGGESGRAARPMHPDWARSLRDQCQR
ncbi:MAG: phage Gp37/Gp68 family protein, partial [Pseudomonadota bacterium]|nr:phage Gp37/Gp68 family protein [Pseudomonadota bacterium]